MSALSILPSDLKVGSANKDDSFGGRSRWRERIKLPEKNETDTNLLWILSSYPYSQHSGISLVFLFTTDSFMEQHNDCVLKSSTQVTNGNYVNRMTAIMVHRNRLNRSCMMLHICPTEPFMAFS